MLYHLRRVKSFIFNTPQISREKLIYVFRKNIKQTKNNLNKWNVVNLDGIFKTR